MTFCLMIISKMSESYKDKNLKKIYRNGNIAWTSSSDMKSYIPEKITHIVDKKTFLHRRENRFRDVVRKVGQEYGFLENYNASITQYDAIRSNEKFIDNRNALSTRKGFTQQGSKLKDTFISKGRLKWTRLCEILLTIIIVSVCISIVIFQTVQCITKYVRIHKNIDQCRMHNLTTYQIFIYILNTFNAIYRYLFQVFSQGHFGNRTCKIYDRYYGKSKCTIY